MTKDLLYKYLSGETLTLQELRGVENAVAENPKLMQEAEVYITENQDSEWEKEVELGIKEYEQEQYRKQLQHLHEGLINEKKSPSSKKRNILLGAAASLVIITGMFLFNHFQTTINYPELNQQFNQPYATNNLVSQIESWGAAGDDWKGQQKRILELVHLFDQKAYSSCIELSQQYIENNQVLAFERQASFLLGQSQKEAGQLDEAIKTFEKLSSEINPYRDDAWWQLSLIYLSKEQNEQIKTWASKITAESEYYLRAQEMLRHF